MERFTADEARARMPSKKRISGTEMLMSHTYRRINGAAVANENFVYINTEPFYRGAIVDTLSALKEDGYDAEYDYSDDRIRIKW